MLETEQEKRSPEEPVKKSKPIQLIVPKNSKNDRGATKLVTLACYERGCRLAHTAGHLQLDQAVQLNRVLHRQFLGDRLNEAVDDQRVGLGLIQSTAHQVEELVVTDFRDGRLVADLGLVLFDAHGGVGIGARMLIEQERVTAHMRLGVVGSPVDADHASSG